MTWFKALQAAALIVMFSSGMRPAFAQSSTSLGAPVPTTHVLVFGDVTPRSPEDMKAIMPREVRDTVALYLEGKIEQWYVQKDAQGVVFIFRAASVEQVRAWTADLPLVKAGIMKLRFVPLGPLRPLQYLTDQGH